MQLLFSFMRRRDKCDACQCESDEPLTPEVKHYGRSTVQLRFCNDECKRDYYQRTVMHNIRAAGL